MQPARADKSGYLIAVLLGAEFRRGYACNEQHPAQDDETHDVQHDGIEEGSNAC